DNGDDTVTGGSGSNGLFGGANTVTGDSSITGSTAVSVNDGNDVIINNANASDPTKHDTVNGGSGTNIAQEDFNDLTDNIQITDDPSSFNEGDFAVPSYTNAADVPAPDDGDVLLNSNTVSLSGTTLFVDESS